ncbi:hypothetical protein [Acaryochloris marina]|uniref:Uncharacterized protein n=1 Tax=Acaryochloris marina (strain MBIC 11017) TaxID=329726 RepID=A8ZPA7_ACAM1|nr:hypothetical protein [Acaryochloris marina]ABW32843.1 hypothetical protein AM1_E0073 [Acaryochloris marina MBIC11017]
MSYRRYEYFVISCNPIFGIYAQIVTYTLMLVIPIIVVTYSGEGIQAAFEYKLGMRTKKSCIKKTAKYAPLLSDWCLNTSEVQAKREAERKEREYRTWLLHGGWRYAPKRTGK